MNKDLLTHLSHSFCNNCCGEEKKFDCDTKQTTCIRLAQFLIDCNKYTPNITNKEKLISQKIGKYASVCLSSFDADRTEDMTKETLNTPHGQILEKMIETNSIDPLFGISAIGTVNKDGVVDSITHIQSIDFIK